LPGRTASIFYTEQNPKVILIQNLQDFSISQPKASSALVKEAEEQPLKAGDFALVNPDEKHQYRNKGDVPFKMICGVPKQFE
jgi:oxalate decarboxylase/phosphoglucose isomerase-like protein (cupin superfamily)